MNGLILCDLDDTKANLTDPFELALKERLPPEAFVTRKPNVYMVEKAFEKQYHETIHKIFCEEGFFLNFSPIEGALEAYNEMKEEGLCLKLCTSPHPDSIYCIPEKMLWVEKHLGREFYARYNIHRQ